MNDTPNWKHEPNTIFFASSKDIENLKDCINQQNAVIECLKNHLTILKKEQKNIQLHMIVLIIITALMVIVPTLRAIFNI